MTGSLIVEDRRCIYVQNQRVTIAKPKKKASHVGITSFHFVLMLKLVGGSRPGTINYLKPLGQDLCSYLSAKKRGLCYLLSIALH